MTAMLDTAVAVRRAAMDLLARREHGRVELTRKLRQRGAPQELIDGALDRLAEEGLLSESRYLETFAIRNTMKTVPKMAGNTPPSVLASRGSSVTNLAVWWNQ